MSNRKSSKKSITRAYLDIYTNVFSRLCNLTQHNTKFSTTDQGSVEERTESTEEKKNILFLFTLA